MQPRQTHRPADAHSWWQHWVGTFRTEVLIPPFEPRTGLALYRKEKKKNLHGLTLNTFSLSLILKLSHLPFVLHSHLSKRGEKGRKDLTYRPMSYGGPFKVQLSPGGDIRRSLLPRTHCPDRECPGAQSQELQGLEGRGSGMVGTGPRHPHWGLEGPRVVHQGCQNT